MNEWLSNVKQYKYHFQCRSVSSTSKYPARLQKESSHCSFASQFLWRECLVAVHQQPPQLALQFQQLPALRGLVNVLVPKSVVQGHREALPGTAGRLGVLDMSMEGRRSSEHQTDGHRKRLNHLPLENVAPYLQNTWQTAGPL